MASGTNQRLNRRKLARGAMALPIAGSLSLNAPTSLPVLARQETGASVPMYRGNAARTGVMPGPGPVGASGVEPLWTNTLEGEAVAESSPAVVEGLLYIGGRNGNVHALDVITGESRWRTAIGDIVFSSPAVVAGVVYVANYESSVFALDAGTGEERWRFPTNGPVFASPAVVDGVVYIGSNDSNVYALDAGTGEERWRFVTEGTRLSSPAVANDVVYVGSYQERNVYALDAATGEERWRFGTEGMLFSPPAVVDDVVYIGDFDGDVYALNATTGEERWRFGDESSRFYFPPAVADGMVFIGNGNPESSGGVTVFALSTDTGEEQWRYSLATQSRTAVVGTPTLADGVVYFGSYVGLDTEDHGLYALSAETGEVLWQLPTDGFTFSSVAVTGGILYVGSSNGVTALAARAPRLEPGATARTIRATSLRGGPSPSAVVREELEQGALLTLTGEAEGTGSGTWWPVSGIENGREGWVIADDLEPALPEE